MKMSKNELDRLLTRNGKGPTQKDRWKAFWRLWRICKRASVHSSPFMLPAAEDSFQWLINDNWEWIMLASSPGDRLAIPLSSIPRIIRKMWIKNDYRKRKYTREIQLAKKQGIVCNEERSKIVAALARKSGIEVTPEEVNKIRSDVCEKLRGSLANSGWKEKDIPVSDEGIIMMLKNAKMVNNEF